MCIFTDLFRYYFFQIIFKENLFILILLKGTDQTNKIKCYFIDSTSQNLLKYIISKIILYLTYVSYRKRIYFRTFPVNNFDIFFKINSKKFELKAICKIICKCSVTQTQYITFVFKYCGQLLESNIHSFLIGTVPVWFFSILLQLMSCG